MGAVTMVVEGVAVVVGEVRAVHVVDEAVAIVVEVVGLLAAAGLAGINPPTSREVRVRKVNAAIYHCDDEIRIALRNSRGLKGVYVNAGGPAVLACVVEAPQFAEARLVGVTCRIIGEVRLSILNLRAPLRGSDGILHRAPLDLVYLGLYEVEILHFFEPYLAPDVSPLPWSDGLFELHDNFAGGELPSRTSIRVCHEGGTVSCQWGIPLRDDCPGGCRHQQDEDRSNQGA